MSWTRWRHLGAVSLVVSAATLSCSKARPLTGDGEKFDVVVYGCTSAGVIAAVQAARMKQKVVALCPDKRLGGMSSNGLGRTDKGNPKSVGGLSREFYRKIRKYYENPKVWTREKRDAYEKYLKDGDVQWYFEPHVAEAVFKAMAKEAKVEVRFGQWLDRKQGVVKREARIETVKMLNGAKYSARSFIDATYEGDLMAAAGVSYTVGREANEQYGETLNGVQTNAAETPRQFRVKMSPYVVPDDPTSGLLPRIGSEQPGKEGSADHRVQAYNFRLCLTDDPANRVPFRAPPGYDRKQYSVFLRWLQTVPDPEFRPYDPLPNRKYDANNSGPAGSDNTGMNYKYPDASYEERKAIVAEHRQYVEGLFYFWSTDPEVPAHARAFIAPFGYAKDEFVDNQNFPDMVYVREARRMVGEFVMTEKDVLRPKRVKDSVGLGSYYIDSHNTMRYVAHDADGKAYVQNEGNVQKRPKKPYPISYRSLIPKAKQATNLLVPVAMSASHVAYGSIRMEPVFMILGQAAGTAAALANESGADVQTLDYDDLRKRLVADGQKL
jgi:hypothetical protein